MGDVKVDYGFQRNLLLTVLTDTKRHLDRQAVVKLHDRKRDNTTWHTTDNESAVTFYDLDFGDYDIEVSAVGYLTERKELQVTGTLDSVKVEVVLKRDPAAVELSAADDAIPANARKDAQRAVRDLKSSNFKQAQKRLENLYRVSPSSVQVNFLLGYVSLQTQDLDKAEDYLGRAATLDPRRVQTFTLLGRVQLQKKHYEAAQKTLESAVSSNSGDWMAHNLLADAYLKQNAYTKAQEQAQIALEQGKGAASAAQLVLGQALANVGKDQEGIAALKSYLQSNPNNPADSQVQALIEKIEQRDSGSAISGETSSAADLALAASPASLPASSWGPAGVDDVKPSVAMGVACPYQRVLDATGDRVKQLVENISRFAAVEDLLHEQLDQSGNPITKEIRKFDYVASISEERPGFLATDEYRNERYGVSDLPDGIVTTGFMTLALIFHPDMRDNFEMTCEGLGDWHGQATWLVHFRQREDRPSRFADYVVGSERYPMKLKGRAWIGANDFQIVRIESDLANRIPQLPVSHQIAEYGPVRFQSKSTDLWLPQHVDIFFEMGRHRYYRRHSFDHYMLFSVNSEEKSPGIKKAPSGDPVQNQ
jgi:tetratricopeptide (TPR) repeat protein